MRKQGLTNGSQPDVLLKAYYPPDTTAAQWKSYYLEINPSASLNVSNVCSTDGTGMNNNDLNSFITVTLNTNSSPPEVYNIPRKNVCNQSTQFNKLNQTQLSTNNNVFYARYKLPAMPTLNQVTGKFIVNIDIQYNNNVQQASGNAVRFVLTDPVGPPKIGPIGSLDNSTSFPVITDWNIGTNGQYANDPTSLVVPFGQSCSAGDANDAKVRIYDADNGKFPHTVKFRVRNNSTGNYVNFSGKGSDNGGGGTFQDGGITYVPPDGSGNTVGKSWATIPTFKVGDHYQMEIYGLDSRNTIDIGLPGDTIYGVIKCPQATITSHAQMQVGAKTYLSGGGTPTVGTGTKVTFFNWVSVGNNQNTGTDQFIYHVASNSLPGAGNSSLSGNPTTPDTSYDLDVSPSSDKPAGQNAFTIILDTPGTYCRKTQITDHPAYVNVNNDPASVCVNVADSTDIKLDGEVDVSPTTETQGRANFDAFVNVSGFPAGAPAGASFLMTCTWSGAASGSVVVSVTGNGEKCHTLLPRTGKIGDQLCMTITPNKPTSWATNPPPGAWNWVPTSDTKCTEFVGLPYLKVYGGDVRTGSGAGGPDKTCNLNDSAAISTHNNGPSGYSGAGAQYAAFAMGNISGFASDAFLATNLPNYLSFAHAGTGNYGGSYDVAPACQDFAAGLPDTPNGSMPGTVSEGSSKIVEGDVYINGNQTYSKTAWTDMQDLKNSTNFRLVVRGNIYIGKNVTQLDGLYIATPDSSGRGGNIYTCASGIGTPITNTMSGCVNQLVVNGAFIAEQVHFERDCGSLVYALGGDSYLGSGGSANQERCSAGNHAAEVFNYSPEQWLPAALAGSNGSYNAITALPPVL